MYKLFIALVKSTIFESINIFMILQAIRSMEIFPLFSEWMEDFLQCTRFWKEILGFGNKFLLYGADFYGHKNIDPLQAEVVKGGQKKLELCRFPYFLGVRFSGDENDAGSRRMPAWRVKNLQSKLFFSYVVKIKGEREREKWSLYVAFEVVYGIGISSLCGYVVVYVFHGGPISLCKQFVAVNANAF